MQDEEDEQDQHMGADDTTATLALQYNPATMQPAAPHSSNPTAAAGASAQARGSSQQEKDGVRPKGTAAAAVAAKAGSAGVDAPGGRKRRTARQGSQSRAAEDASDAEAGDDDAEEQGGPGADADTAAATAAAAKGPSSKRRATLAAATAAAAVAGSSRPGNRRATIVTGRSALAGSAAVAGAVAKSPLPGTRPGSSRPAAWDCTPAAAGGPASLADRPPFTVGPPTAGAAGAGVSWALLVAHPTRMKRKALVKPVQSLTTCDVVLGRVQNLV